MIYSLKILVLNNKDCPSLPSINLSLSPKQPMSNMSPITMLPWKVLHCEEIPAVVVEGVRKRENCFSKNITFLKTKLRIIFEDYLRILPNLTKLIFCLVQYF